MNIKNILLLLFLSLPVGLLGLDKEPKKKNAKVEDSKDNYKITFAKKVRDIIKSGGNLNVCDENDSSSLLLQAYYNNDIELVTEMLQTNNIIVDYKGGSDRTLLMTACMSHKYKNNSELIQLLLDYGADINQNINSIYLTPLMWASREGNKENVKTLLKNRANINGTTSRGMTALMAACQTLHDNADCELIQILLSYGADPNMQMRAYDDGNKITALMILVKKSLIPDHSMEEEKKLVEIARLLIFSGADPEIRDSNGKTFLDYAQKESFRAKLENICKEYKEYLKQCLKSSDTYNITHLPSPINNIVVDYVL